MGAALIMSEYIREAYICEPQKQIGFEKYSKVCPIFEVLLEILLPARLKGIFLAFPSAL